MKKSFGAIFSPADVRDYRISKAVNYDFPEEFSLPYIPTVKNQGDIGSCVAHSIASTIEYFSYIQGDETKEMSIGYIYGNRRNTKHYGSGMIVRDALTSTCKYGDIINEFFPYNIEVPNAIKEFEKTVDIFFEKGYPNRFSSYFRCYNNNDIKNALFNKKSPVIFGIQWFSDIKVNRYTGIIETSINYNATDGGHCMVIYGWNKDGWIIQNSWGLEWGINGKAILPYEVPIEEAWGVIDEILALDAKEDAEKLKRLEDLVDERNLEIERLKNEDSDIKKPYNSKIGKIVAKVFNSILKISKKSKQ